MCSCKYCLSGFQPRAQVKNPQACSNEDCQRKRQRDNEKAWHMKNRGLYDAKYHSVKKKKRLESLWEKARVMWQAMQVGSKMLGVMTLAITAEKLLYRFFVTLGVRQVNKLCQC
jgi:hypothetical protein